VTSPDGGGSTQSDPQGDGPAESSRRNAAAPGPGDASPDHDPVRLIPPADPWLAEAPTSIVGDATSSRGFGAATGEAPPADTARFAAPAPFHGEAPYGGQSSGWQEGPRRRRDRRAIRWVLAVLAACALFVAGMLAIDRFGSGGDGDARGSDPSTAATAVTTPTGIGQERPPTAGPAPAPVGGVPSANVTTGRQPGEASVSRPDNSAGAAAPDTSANAGSPEVVYEVTASGSRNTGSVSYTDQDGEIIRRNGIPLPWRITFPVGAQRKPLVLIAQRKGGGDAGPVTCTITVDGKLLASTTANGAYAAPQCSGSG
jgi:hypothetical protein